MWHLGNNITKNYKAPGLRRVFMNIAEAYSESKFYRLFVELSHKHPDVTNYLKDLKFEYWSRLFSS